MSDQTRLPPLKEFSSGGVSAAIWKNEVTDAKGDTRIQHSVRIQKQYKDPKTGEWCDSTSFFPNDLPRLELVARKAFEFVTLRERDPQAATAFPPDPAEDAAAPVEEEPATEV
jgi:hypothetical protein